MKYKPLHKIEFSGHSIGENSPVFFIADIAANHDGDIHRAKYLIHLAAESGADAAKFQHFSAQTIVCDYGFRNLGSQKSHQSRWGKSVFDVYKDASLPDDWTETLKETCDKAGIVFFTSPYSIELIDKIDSYVDIYKIGSGDITWHEIIRYIAKKGKPVLLATGASNLKEVQSAVEIILDETPELVLMQCNTNYVASPEQFKHINLRVLNSFSQMYPGIILGLSDHTHGCATVLGSVAMGAKVIEKHFTDDRNRTGPDHSFSTDPSSWKEMVERTRELEQALGNGEKRVEENENITVVLQRRSIRASTDILKGQLFSNYNLEVLRPCPEDGIPPYKINDVIGKTAGEDIPKGRHIKWTDME